MAKGMQLSCDGVFMYQRGKVGGNERSELHQLLKEARGAMRCAYCTLRYYLSFLKMYYNINYFPQFFTILSLNIAVFISFCRYSITPINSFEKSIVNGIEYGLGTRKS